MNIIQLKFTKLFGHFDHCIDFKDENITIITAPNGYGKTICLKVIDAIFNRKLSFLCNLHFDMIELLTSNGTLTIKKDLKKFPIEIVLDHNDAAKPYKFTLQQSYMRPRAVRMLESRLPFLERNGDDEWVDVRTDTFYTEEEMLEEFRHLLPPNYSLTKNDDWYINFSKSLNVYFVQDQRLIQRRSYHRRYESRNEENTIDTIVKYANELSELIKKSSVDASQISQQLDSTFPQRLLSNSTDHAFRLLDQPALKKGLAKVQKRRENLSKYDLLSTDIQHLQTLDLADDIKPEDAKVLTLYLNDTERKLSSYDEIFRKIDLFSEILNNKQLSFKSILISSENGFQFKSNNGADLELTQLSSGEQHQVVLLYELIFRTKENILVLIDEPEISLHVAWQNEFLRDLKQIVKIQNMAVVIATHSPQIVNRDWDLTVNLPEGTQ